MTTTYYGHEDMNEPPKRQTATSIFKMFVGSLLAAILLAIGATWLLYAVLPERVADIYAPQVWAACLGTGAGTTVAAAVGLVKRSLDITGKKLTNPIKQSTPPADTATTAPQDMASHVPTSDEFDDEVQTFDVGELK